MVACGCFPDRSPENRIHHSIETTNVAMADSMMRVCADEDRILKGMEVDCVHLMQLKEASSQLEEKRRQMYAMLAEQSRLLEAITQQQPVAHPACAPSGALPGHGVAPPKPRLDGGGISAAGGGPQPEQILPPLPALQFLDGGSMAPRSDSRLDWKLDKEIRIHDGKVAGVDMGLGSDAIATASSDGSAKIFSLQANSVVRTFNMATDGGLTAVSFSRTEEGLLASTSSDQSVYLWNHQDGVLRHRLVGHTREVNDLDFHPTQPILATGSGDCSCIVWDVQEGSLLRTLGGHSKPVSGCTFLGHQNPYFLATASLDQRVRIFDMRDKSEVRSPKQYAAGVTGIDYSAPKELMATCSEDGTICAWETRTWACLWEARAFAMTPRTREAKSVSRVAFSPNGALLATACSSGQVLIYETQSGRHVASLDGHAASACDVAWGVEAQTGAKLLVSASADGTCRVWRAMI